MIAIGLLLLTTSERPASCGARPPVPRPQHGAPFIDSRIHYQKIVTLREHVLIDEMHPAFLRRRTDLLAILHEAAKRFLVSRPSRLGEGIVVLGNVQAEEVLRGEVSVAFGTAVAVGFGVVDFEVGEGGEGEGFGVGGQGAFHCCSW